LLRLTGGAGENEAHIFKSACTNVHVLFLIKKDAVIVLKTKLFMVCYKVQTCR